jgi:hypothetical protein
MNIPSKKSFTVALAIAGAIVAATPTSALTIDPEIPRLVPGSTTEAMTWTTVPISSPGWDGNANVAGRSSGLKFRTEGALNAVAFPNCSSDDANPSQLSQCGVVVKVDDVNRSADFTAYTINNGSQIRVVFPDPFTAGNYIELDSTVFTLELAEDLFTLDENPQQEFSFNVDVSNGGSISWIADSTSFYGDIVTFDANGGTGEMPPTYVVLDTALPENMFEMAGRQFAGWATSQSGALSGTVDFLPGADYAGGRATLYAVWTDGSGGSQGSGSGGAPLASTGFDTLSASASGVLLLVVGILLGLASAAQRERRN